ncbi:hypothetical protein ADU59_07715 [Pararhizobium polonicum]|uniref:DNA-binding protein n=1 Tax=Pararhizobium polonicum TaxID=1612624 RepID=A0A1C7P4Q8_9HYPH|nr:hypothetical protein [Pararhizobium polonicum]OBZ96230.1 hypothetical protein ADU59_07715 [Pararhizobium polonicum]
MKETAKDTVTGNNIGLITGAANIGNEIGMSATQVYSAFTAGHLGPVFKLGGKLAVRRSKLETWISALEAA